MSLNPQGPHLERAEVGMILEVPAQDGATFTRAKVIAANDRYFMVEYEAPFAGRRQRIEQGALGVVLVSYG